MAETLRKKNKGPDFRVYVGTSFPNPIFCEIESLAKQHELAAAQVVRELKRAAGRYTPEPSGS